MIERLTIENNYEHGFYLGKTIKDNLTGKKGLSLEEALTIANDLNKDYQELKNAVKESFKMHSICIADVRTLLFIISISKIPMLSDNELEAISRVQVSVGQDIIDLDKIKEGQKK